MDYGQDTLAASLVLKDHIGRGVGKVVPRKLQVVFIALDHPGWSLAKKKWEKAEQGCFARSVFAGQGSMAGQVDFYSLPACIRVNENHPGEAEIRSMLSKQRIACCFAIGRIYIHLGCQ